MIKIKIRYICFTEESLQEAEQKFGASRKFINSINSLNDQRNGGKNVLCDEVIEEAKILASCTFEENTSWGKEVSIIYILGMLNKRIRLN